MFHIIYNPNSGVKKTKKTASFVENTLKEAGYDVVLHPTERKGHASEITAELNKNDDLVNIIIIGGDGTFSEVINGVQDFDKVVFGLVPCGTGNDFAKKLGLSKNPKKALQNILKGNVAHLDYIQMPNRRCLNVCGVGMDVDVLVRYENMKHFHGKIKYYLSLIDTLIHFKGHKVKVTIADTTTEQEVFMVAIANGTYIGGGMPISPESDVKDGLLDLVVIDKLKGKQIPGALINFLRGKLHKKPCAHTYKSSEAQVEILDEGKVQIDGEVLTDTTILQCEIVRNKLKLLM